MSTMMQPKESEIDPSMFSPEESLIYEKIRRQQILDGERSDEEEKERRANEAAATKKERFSASKITQIFKKAGKQKPAAKDAAQQKEEIIEELDKESPLQPPDADDQQISTIGLNNFGDD